MKACILCQKSASTPRNFLLSCSSCLHSSHHRCLVPPVPDKDLIALIQAFNARRHEPGASLVWTCPTCTCQSNTTEQAHIVIDDDDEIIQPVTKKVTGRKTIQSAPQRVSRKTAGSPDGIRIIDDPFSASPAPPARPRPLQPVSSTSTIAPLSGFIDLTMSSDDDTQSRKETRIEADASDEDPLEYVTPPPAPPVTVPPSRSKTVTFQENAHVKVLEAPAVIPPPTAITSFMNERHANDIWGVAAQRRKLHPTPPFVIKQEDADGPPLPSLSTSRRNKPAARKLNTEQQTRKTFVLNVNVWMRERSLVHRAS